MFKAEFPTFPEARRPYSRTQTYNSTLQNYSKKYIIIMVLCNLDQIDLDEQVCYLIGYTKLVICSVIVQENM